MVLTILEKLFQSEVLQSYPDKKALDNSLINLLILESEYSGKILIVLLKLQFKTVGFKKTSYI